MFKKKYEVKIASVCAMDLVMLLCNHGVRFKVSEEYLDEQDPDRRWFRHITFRASKRTINKIIKEGNVKIV